MLHEIQPLLPPVMAILPITSFRLDAMRDGFNKVQVSNCFRNNGR
jgi:hypothetical protein